VLRFFWFSAAAVAVAIAGTLGACGGGDDASGPIVVDDASTGFDAHKGDDGGTSGSDVGAPSTCAPASVANFEPHWVKPEPLHEGACTKAQLDAFETSCGSTKIYGSACATFQGAQGNEACAKCLFGGSGGDDAGAPAFRATAPSSSKSSIRRRPRSTAGATTTSSSRPTGR